MDWDDRWYQIVPKTDYAAWRVFRDGEWAYTDIQHVGDDPLFEFLPEVDSNARDINAVHRAPYRQMAALTKEYGPHVRIPMEKAEDAEDRMALWAFMAANPDVKSYALPSGRMGFVRG